MDPAQVEQERSATEEDVTTSLRLPDSFEETLADMLRIKAPPKKAKAAKKRAAKKKGKVKR